MLGSPVCGLVTWYNYIMQAPACDIDRIALALTNHRYVHTLIHTYTYDELDTHLCYFNLNSSENEVSKELGLVRGTSQTHNIILLLEEK